VPAWLWGVLGGTLLVGVAGAGFGLSQRRRQPKRLGLAERERLLADVRQWIDVADPR
jgi:hypothetical protein